MSEDMLTAFFEMQLFLQQKMGYDFEAMSDKDKVQYIKEYSLHLTDEIHEMLRELPYLKPWKNYDKFDAVRGFQKARAEIVDAVHFLLNILLALGYTPETLFDAFQLKNSENHKRQQNTDEYKKCED